MNMQHTYGIFDDEADHIIDLVRRHAPLAQILGTRCPACGSAMAVDFVDGGTGFQVHCEGKPLHISKYQEIDDPPSWWPTCVIPPTDSTWYWRDWHSFDGDGNLTMKVSGWRADGVRWSGEFKCATSDPDYAFWRWVLLQSGCTSDLIDEAEVAELRARFTQATE
jgi:hypothetical protein